MKTLEELELWLEDKKLTFIAKDSEVSYPVVWRVAKGRADNASYSTIKRLSDYVESKDLANEQHR